MAKLKEVDEVVLREAAHMHCTMEEIAILCKVSIDTLERRFAAIIKEEREGGKMSLRRWQWKLAATGNLGMLIWLGKQHLGQRDKRDLDLTTAQKTAQEKPLEELIAIVQKKNE